MTRRYKDFYGCTASVTEYKDGSALLKVSMANGKQIHNKDYNTVAGARRSMNRMSDGWKEIKK